MHLYEEQVGLLLELEIKFMPGQRTKKEQISGCCGHTIECKTTPPFRVQASMYSLRHFGADPDFHPHIR